MHLEIGSTQPTKYKWPKIESIPFWWPENSEKPFQSSTSLPVVIKWRKDGALHSNQPVFTTKAFIHKTECYQYN
jgi:hypothetical protein